MYLEEAEDRAARIKEELFANYASEYQSIIYDAFVVPDDSFNAGNVYKWRKQLRGYWLHPKDRLTIVVELENGRLEGARNVIEKERWNTLYYLVKDIPYMAESLALEKLGL